MKRQYNDLEAPIAITTATAAGAACIGRCEQPKLKKMAILDSYPSPKEMLPDAQGCCTALIPRPITPVDKIIDSLAQGPPSPTRSVDELNLSSMSCPSPIDSLSPISCPTPASTPIAGSPVVAHSPLSIDLDTTSNNNNEEAEEDEEEYEITGYFNPFTALHFTPLAPFNNAPYPFTFIEPPRNLDFVKFKPPPPIFLSSLTGKATAAKRTTTTTTTTTQKLLPSPEFSLPPSEVGNSACIDPQYTRDSEPSFFMEKYSTF
ncbi:hypothetical protein Cantr_09244 [Candida viswanathii]|uniref:Uncharacterized protein n=1 Tax=Candida viswanathii TaxID=5486 RepID=A0A367Y9N8_9ASCO|nr:hypothetical protein Cantr_09244 [Candida viswanathii]